MKYKRVITLFSVLTALTSIQFKAYANTNDTNNNGFLQQINQQYSNINGQIQNLTSDFISGLGKLSGEIQSQIHKTIGDLGLPDIVSTGRKIEETIANQKSDILQLDPRILGKNARQEWNQKYTVEQSRGILGIEGQKIMKQEGEISQTAADIALDKGSLAQSDVITQDIMKKIATQNSQIATVLKLVQSSLQEQNKLSATTNVNLSDISQNLSTEQRRKQNESQGTINAIYRNTAFLDGFLSSNK
jgi:hypothetical protein